MKNSGLIFAAALVFSIAATVTNAQAPAGAPPATAAPPSAPAQRVPPFAAPTIPAVSTDPFPPVDPRFFTSSTPSVETVNSFLEAIWGYAPERVWRVMAVQKTPAAGVIKVTVFVSEKTPNAKMQQATLYVTPDEKHVIAEGSGVVPFGANPFADLRELLKARADGASRGAASKDFEMVEFADLQCPHCKEAQGTMDQLVKDFPKAHVVFQPFPLVAIHSSAYKAAAFGVCAQKVSNDAFFKYAAAVFELQDSLTPASDDTVLKAAAVKAGLDGAAITACAATQATKDVVDADTKLAEEADIEQTPALVVNGRPLPVTDIPYETLKKIIVFQAKMDGVETGASADILAPPPPKLSTLPK